jgi:hypothetical protein
LWCRPRQGRRCTSAAARAELGYLVGCGQHRAAYDARADSSARRGRWRPAGVRVGHDEDVACFEAW